MYFPIINKSNIYNVYKYKFTKIETCSKKLLHKGPYIYDIQEKCPIFAPTLPPFSVCPNGSELGKTPHPTPRRRNLDLQHCLDSNNTYTSYSCGHPISVDTLPLPPLVTIHSRLNFHHFSPDPPSPHQLDVINVWSLRCDGDITRKSCVTLFPLWYLKKTVLGYIDVKQKET